ncbi:hypothetical protein ACN47E_009708 [Coniothyrium glycines]
MSLVLHALRCESLRTSRYQITRGIDYPCYEIPRMTLTIRRATPADEPALAALSTIAWFNECLFGDTIHPNRHEYPDDVQIFWHQAMRKHFYCNTEVILVATTTEEEQEKIVALAIWQRQGDDAGVKQVQEEWSNPGPNAFPPLSSENNRALNPSKRTILEDAFPYFAHYWDGERRNNWYLSLCGTHPDYQGRGYGRQLVLWGLDRAREENVHASVVASEGNSPFYLRCGYDEVIANVTKGEGNPLNGVSGGDLLFMWPKNHASTSF